ncbi:glycosyltransferase [Streptomyces sp. SID10853]|uniref:glycosyltransferase n=1 Tax=Streptomyces sp. SID10853 TaxID=2706028 RepID=UPI0013C1649D|nr:glycosyltransferase [Streptomyces sp. SID10853]NDZ79895.1 glycosyltransferase [Streptomyces sp. SID10853]
MRVLHIITGLGVGGAEQQLRLLLRQLPVECDVVTLTNPGPVADGLRADGVSVTHLGMRGNRDLAALPRLARLIRRGRYDLVHTHLYRACVYGRIAARLAGVRATVATEHSLGARYIEGRPLTRSARALYLRTERLGSATVAVSATVADRLRGWGVPAARIHVVPNGIDGARFRHDPRVRAATRALLGIPADAFVVGGVGRLVPGKRFDLLVRAVAALPEVRLLLAGDGPEREALRTLAGQLGAGDRIHLIGECDALPDALPDGRSGERSDALPDGRSGERSDGLSGGPHAGPTAGPHAGPTVPAVLDAADVFVSASDEESFGLAVVEALAAGLPVLYAVCPALDDLQAGPVPGAVRVPGGAAEIEAALRHQLSLGARRLDPSAVVGHYDIARSAAGLLGVYARTVASAPAVPRVRPPFVTPVP